MKIILIILITLSAGCATPSTLAPIEYSYVDNIGKQQIELTYHNESKKTRCLSPSQWPNSSGKIDQGGDYVFLIVEGKRFAIENFNTGYCPKCSIAVAPNKQITTFISYHDFDLPDDLIKKTKQLEFHPKAYNCSR